MTSQGKSTWFDRLLACVWALGVGAFAFFLNDTKYIPVESADSLSVAFGLRPPENPLPLLWHSLISCINSHCGIVKTMRCLYVLGPVSLAFSAFISTRLFSLLLPASLQTSANSRRWGRVITYILPILGSAVFVFSSPVWSLGEIFLPETLALMLFLSAVFFAVRSFRRMSVTCFILTGVFSGLLSAETPIGFIIPLLSSLYLHFRYYREDEITNYRLANPLLQSVLIKWMLFAFVVFWITALSLNMRFFFEHNAYDSQSGFFLQLVRISKRYGALVCSMISPLGWAFAGVTVLAPVVFSFACIRRATDIKTFLYIRYSFLFLMFGLLALLQSSPFSSWWFWRWISDIELVSSDFILGVCILGTSCVVFAAICVFAVDIYFRNSRALAREFFWDENPDVPMIVKIKRRLVISGRVFRLVFMPLIVSSVLLIVVLGRINRVESRAKAIVDEYVANVVRECSDKPVLITDGALDALIELRAAIEGKDIKTLSLMSGNGKYEAVIRRRVDVENKYSAELNAGTADALRTWMLNDSPMISNLAVQVGFELWRMNNRNFPRCGGFLGKSGESDDFDTQKGINAAYSLADEILSFREECDISDVEPLKLRSALSRIQWRLSRMCAIRAYTANRAKDGAAAEKENNLAERLDEANPEYKKVKAIGDEILQKNTTLTLTSREGLNISLRRADFRLAAGYAKKVILQDENDVSANFALGMDHFMNHRYAMAEEYLKRALKNSPDEPAVLNNLAVVLIRMDRYDEAETNALKALKILPDSKEVQETLRRIRELKSKEK